MPFFSQSKKKTVIVPVPDAVARRIVFFAETDIDCGTLALVSRAFYSHAQTRMWKDLKSIVPILRAFCYLVKKHFNPFYIYAFKALKNRVQTITIDDYESDERRLGRYYDKVMRFFKLYTYDTRIFPNLHTLQITIRLKNSQRALYYWNLLCHDGVKDVIIVTERATAGHYGFQRMVETKIRLLRETLYSIPNLNFLDISLPPSTDTLLHIPIFRNLHTICLKTTSDTPLPMHIIRDVSELTQLRSLSITTTNIIEFTSQHPTSPENPLIFRKLDWLYITSTQDAATYLIDRISCPILHKFVYKPMIDTKTYHRVAHTYNWRGFLQSLARCMEGQGVERRESLNLQILPVSLPHRNSQCEVKILNTSNQALFPTVNFSELLPELIALPLGQLAIPAMIWRSMTEDDCYEMAEQFGCVVKGVASGGLLALEPPCWLKTPTLICWVKEDGQNTSLL